MLLHKGNYIALVKEGHWEYAQRVHVTGAVVILAVTDDRKIILVEQYRIPVQARTIELPAGIIGDGDSNEDTENAARRELLEETGYAAEKIAILTTGPSSAGLTSELVTLVQATGLRGVQAGGGVEHENITVHEVGLTELDGWLAAKAKAGLLIDPKIYAGLYFVLSQHP
jgi:ADP-ribose pyrophosphatase